MKLCVFTARAGRGQSAYQTVTSPTLVVGYSVTSQGGYVPMLHLANAPLTGLGASVSASGTVTMTEFTANANVWGQTQAAYALVSDASFLPAEITGSSALTALPGELAAEGTFAPEGFLGNADLTAASASVSGDASFAPPSYTADANVWGYTQAMYGLESDASFVPAEITGDAALTAVVAEVSADGNYALGDFVGNANVWGYTQAMYGMEASGTFEAAPPPTGSELTYLGATITYGGQAVTYGDAPAAPDFGANASLEAAVASVAAEGTHLAPVSADADLTANAASVAADASFSELVYTANANVWGQTQAAYLLEASGAFSEAPATALTYASEAITYGGQPVTYGQAAPEPDVFTGDGALSEATPQLSASASYTAPLTPTDYYLRNNVSGESYPLSTTQGTGPNTITTSTNSTTTYAQVARFEVEVGSSIGSASIPYSINVTAVSSAQLLYQWRVQRANSSGVVQASSAYSTADNTTGVKTGTLTLDTSWSAGDKLVLSVEVRRNGGSGDRTITLQTESASSYLRPSLT
jgi:hypothetical protein